MIDWDAYRDDLGFLSGEHRPQGSDGNAMLRAACEMTLRQGLGTWKSDDQDALFERVRDLCEIRPGLIQRLPPFSRDQEGLDDYIAYVLIDPVFAFAALQYGRASFYRPLKWAPWLRIPYQYSIKRDPHDVAAWLGRYPALVAHMEWSTHAMTPPLWRRVWWAASVAFSGSSDNEDPWVLSWLMIVSAGRRRWLERLATDIYLWRLKRSKGSLALLFAAHFRNPNHPIARACEELAL